MCMEAVKREGGKKIKENKMPPAVRDGSQLLKNERHGTRGKLLKEVGGRSQTWRLGKMRFTVNA